MDPSRGYRGVCIAPSRKALRRHFYSYYDKMVEVTTENTTLQILSLNVERGALCENLLDYIRGYLPEVSVFCFQETDGGILPFIDDMLRDDFNGYHALKPAEPNPFTLSTYIRKDIQVEEVDSLYEDNFESDVGLVMFFDLCTKDGARLNVANVYGAPYPGNKLDTSGRLKVTRELVERGKELNYPQVLIGDFNLLPEAQSVREFAANGYRDLIDEYKIPTTRNERAWKRYPDSPQLYADYAFVRGDSMRCDFAVDDVMVSDHLPLRLRISLS